MRRFSRVGFEGVSRRSVVPFPMFVLMVALVLFGLLYCSPRDVAYASAAPAPVASKVGAMVIELVREKAVGLGYSSLDSVVTATTDAMGTEMGLLADVAAQTEAAALGAVVSETQFAAILEATAVTPVGVGLGLLLTPSGLGDDSLVKWQLNHDGTVSVTVVQPVQVGGHWQYYETSIYSKPVTDSSVSQHADYASLADAAAAYASNGTAWNDAELKTWGAGSKTYPDIHITFVGPCDDSTSNVRCTFSAHDVTGNIPDSQAGGGMVGFATGKNGTPPALQPGGDYVPPATTTSMTLDQAESSIPSSESARPMSPQLLANLADALWQLAAQQSGYSGVPYPATNPVTSSDVSTAVGSQPSLAPGVSDLVSPVAVPAPGTSPTGGTNPTGGTGSTGGTNPGGGSSPTGGTDPASGTQPASGASPTSGTSPSGGGGPTNDATENLCQQDPGIVACQGLGTPPAAPDLPSSTATVSLSPVSVGGPANPVCPLPVSVTVFGTTLTFSYQTECDFMVHVKPFIIALCGVAAAMIFVSGLKS